jgi:hypothetical protein
LRQTAVFQPRGLFGLLYWYAVAPFHGIVFQSMLTGIKRDAVQIATSQSAPKAEGGREPKAEIPSAPGPPRS